MNEQLDIQEVLGRRKGQSHSIESSLQAERRGVDCVVVPTNGEEVWRGFSHHANCESGTEYSAANAAQLSVCNSSVTKDPAWNEGDSTVADNTTTTTAPMPTPSTPENTVMQIVFEALTGKTITFDVEGERPSTT